MTHRPSQEQLAIYRKHRQERKGRIGIGHVPSCSIVQVEFPSHKATPLADGSYPLRTMLTSDVVRQGADGWCVDMCDFQEVTSPDGLLCVCIGADHHRINIDFIKRVVQRGVPPTRILNLKQPVEPYRYGQEGFRKTPNQYCTRSMSNLVRWLLDNHPKLSYDWTSHLVDFQPLLNYVLAHPTVVASCSHLPNGTGVYKTYGSVWTISKKKLVKILKQALPHFYIRRSLEQSRQIAYDYEYLDTISL